VQKCIRYTYSLVLAADMYVTVIKKDPLDAALEKFYKDKILLVDSSQEETESF
jgi:Zn-dependent oligopeptidase